MHINDFLKAFEIQSCFKENVKYYHCSIKSQQKLIQDHIFLYLEGKVFLW